MDEHKSAVRMFQEFLGDALPVRKITKQHVIRYKQALLDTPTRYTLPVLAQGELAGHRWLKVLFDGREAWLVERYTALMP